MSRQPASGPTSSSAAAPAVEYVYQQDAPSVVEGVLSTILHPGVNSQTFSVLNVTLVVLFFVISAMLFVFDGIESRFRLHLWIFLAVCCSLIMAVNWFFARYNIYGNDDEEEEGDEEDEEEEGEEEEEEEKEEASVAQKSATSKPTPRAAAQKANKESSTTRAAKK